LASCAQKIGLSHWALTLDLNDGLLEARETDASVDIRPRLYQATVYIRSDSQNDLTGRERIAHELYHVAMAEFNEVIRAMMECIPGEIAGPLKYLYEGAEERLVTRLARTLAEEDFDG
jgi:hypothetical protein